MAERIRKEPLPRAARDVVARLIFGLRDARYTQDSPVLPDVWREFAENPGQPADLLLTPHVRAGAGTLSVLLRERLAADRKRRGHEDREAAAIAYNQFNLVARIHLDELVRVVLPMTSWWQSTRKEIAIFRKALETPKGRREMAVLLDLFRQQAGLVGEDGGGEVEDAGEQSEALAKQNAEALWLCHLIGGLLWLAERLAEQLAGRKAGSKPARLRDLELPTAQQVIDSLREVLDGLVEHEVTDETALWQINRNRTATVTVQRSVLTVKGDAVRNLFRIDCREITWAVIDSGIDASHPAFRNPCGPPPAADAPWWQTTRVDRTFDFTLVRQLLSAEELSPDNAALAKRLRDVLAARPELVEELKELRRHLEKGRRVDWSLLEPFLDVPHDEAYTKTSVPGNEHGTHVAGILGAAPVVGKEEFGQGMCPEIRLYDLRVLDRYGAGDEFAVISALQFVGHLNSDRDHLVIHGANMSLSIRHEVESFACGATPVCDEAERLVAAGVVVVAAAGNQGFAKLETATGTREAYQSLSITDPGNAPKVITVGATHRSSPHTYGISYFSSRGPTGDGRAKPDLVAPGEKITAPVPGGQWKRKDGTSMAAPHVSGVAALLMARNNELVGKAERIKDILCRSATDLGRERYFQGHGLVDALRALQLI